MIGEWFATHSEDWLLVDCWGWMDGSCPLWSCLRVSGAQAFYTFGNNMPLSPKYFFWLSWDRKPQILTNVTHVHVVYNCLPEKLSVTPVSHCIGTLDLLVRILVKNCPWEVG